MLLVLSVCYCAYCLVAPDYKNPLTGSEISSQSEETRQLLAPPTGENSSGYGALSPFTSALSTTCFKEGDKNTDDIIFYPYEMSFKAKFFKWTINTIIYCCIIFYTSLFI